MAEVKNSFLSSKMNQDLDDRLIPNGEYRTALNVSIGKSENSDIGTLQNILGNQLVNSANTIIGLECIGYYMDNAGNRIFQFLTNEGDNLTDPVYHQITVYDFNTNTYTVLVEGAFLNFSKDYPVTGVTLVENLLFWTDYYNQPRKINIQSASNFPASSASPYYINEDQISVAKYAPVEAISLYKKIVTTNTSIVTSSPIIPVASVSGIEEGMTLIGGSYTSNNFIIVESIDTGASTITVSSSVSLADDTTLTLLISTMTNESADPYWPGDPEYLKTKYVRFSYRFKLDDGEYTLMAPFTQIAYIPNQKGYFINGDENDAYTSTVLNWFENNVNNIQLLVPFPDLVANVNQSYKIQALDIIYKESDSLETKILDTVLYADFAQNTLNNSNIYVYDYQSRKPYRTLPTEQATRVYDIVPVKAKAQETSSNRIIYGNIVKGYTAPQSLNYQVTINEKQDYSSNFIEYPNHTVKQNRTYQVGFILSDKYGRQSSVILSSLDATATATGSGIFGGSTVYSSYYSAADRPSVRDWFGDAISILLNNPIVSSANPSTGEPGLYAESTSTTGFTLTGTTTITDTTYNFEISAGTPPNQGEYLRGAYTDYVEITSITEVSAGVYNAVTSGRVSDLYARNTNNDPDDIKFVYIINPLGWYSYKIVVRQQDQDYYNVYLPGFLNGYPKGQTYGSQVVYAPGTGIPSTDNGINTSVFPTTEFVSVAHTVLINDNINKIPRDLVEVGPDQKLYRSSVQLFGRVENTINAGVASNTQYFPSKKADTAIAIASSSELGFLPATVDNTLGSATYNFYQLETNPLIARISTTNDIGVVAVENDNTPPTYPSDPDNMIPYLSVYETKPDYSLLDIFWETSTSGLISDLNTDVLTGYDGVNGISEINWEGFREDLEITDSTKYITTSFYPVSNTGIPVNSSGGALTVFDANGTDCTAVFALEATSVALPVPHMEYRIYATQYLIFQNDVNLGKYTFYFSFIQDGQTVPTTYSFQNQLRNVTPIITDFDLNPISGPIDVYLNSPSNIGFPVYSMWGYNGANTNAGTVQSRLDLLWKVNNTGSTANWQTYFNVITDPAAKTCGIYQIAELPEEASFTLNIELWDATSASGIPASGSGVYGSLYDSILVNIELASTIICGRRWTTRNYGGTKYQDGSDIPQALTPTEWANATGGMWCWPNFDEVLGQTYGKLYNGYAIEGIWDASQPGNKKTFAPAGFRVPFYNEHTALNCVAYSNMKALDPAYPDPLAWQNIPQLGDDSTNFSALPAGWVDETGLYHELAYNPSDGKTALFHMHPAGTYLQFYDNYLAGLPATNATYKWGMSVRFINENSVNFTATSPAGGGTCSLQFANVSGVLENVTVGNDFTTVTEDFVTADINSISSSCNINY